MASNTNKLKTKRKSRKRNMGKERKRVYRNKGTTPPFPIHPEETPNDEKSLIIDKSKELDETQTGITQEPKNTKTEE